MGQWSNNWAVVLTSILQLHIGFKQSWKLCLNLRSRRWLKLSRNLVINFTSLGLRQLKKEFALDWMNFRIFLMETLIFIWKSTENKVIIIIIILKITIKLLSSFLPEFWNFFRIQEIFSLSSTYIVQKSVYTAIFLTYWIWWRNGVMTPFPTLMTLFHKIAFTITTVKAVSINATSNHFIFLISVTAIDITLINRK